MTAAVPAVLGSPRVVLTPTGPADRDAIVALHADQRVTAHLLDGIPDEAWKADIYLRWAAELHAAGIGPWTARRRTDDAFLGLFTLTPVEGEPDALEFGGRMARAGWHGDLAVEAGAAVIEHGFSDLGRGVLVSLFSPDNLTAPVALKRLGFSGAVPTEVFGKPGLAARLTAAAWREQDSRPHPPAPRAQAKSAA